MERRRKRRRIKNGKEAAAAAVEEEPRTTIHDVPDDLLRQILLRLDSPLWLLRASCASKPLRRAVIAGGRAFLRLAASLHPPFIVGHYHSVRSNPWPGNAFVPSSPAPPFVDNGRFLPRRLLAGTRDRHVADCHGGLVLVLLFASPPELIVYDPLSRRRQGIYRPPDHHAAGHKFADAFLLDGDDGEVSISNFRVLYRFDGGSRACVFSTAADDGEGGWRLLRKPAAGGGGTGRVAGRIDGALYVGLATGTVMGLDNASLEFSEVPLPTIRIETSDGSSYGSTFIVVHGSIGGASPPTARIVHVHGEALEVFRRVDGGSSGGEWVLEHSISRLLRVARKKLPSCPKAKKGVERMVKMDVMAAGGTAGLAVVSMLIAGYGRWFFSVDVDTMELKEVPQESYRDTHEIFTYALPWPRLLRACPC